MCERFNVGGWGAVYFVNSGLKWRPLHVSFIFLVFFACLYALCEGLMGCICVDCGKVGAKAWSGLIFFCF